jgi:hypothetical protein
MTPQKPQTIRFVGGPYHGRTLAVDGNVVELATLNNRPVDFFCEDGTQKNAAPVDVQRTRYYRSWLARSQSTLYVREQVMVWENLRPGSDESIQRWQELRAA